MRAMPCHARSYNEDERDPCWCHVFFGRRRRRWHGMPWLLDSQDGSQSAPACSPLAFLLSRPDRAREKKRRAFAYIFFLSIVLGNEWRSLFLAHACLLAYTHHSKSKSRKRKEVRIGRFIWPPSIPLVIPDGQVRRACLPRRPCFQGTTRRT